METDSFVKIVFAKVRGSWNISFIDLVTVQLELPATQEWSFDALIFSGLLEMEPEPGVVPPSVSHKDDTPGAPNEATETPPAQQWPS